MSTPRIELLEERCLLSGGMREYMIPTPNSHPIGIAAGPDSNIWAVGYASGPRTDKIWRMSTDGEFTPSDGFDAVVSSYPIFIVAGPDGNLWFTEDDARNGNDIVRMNPSGEVTGRFPVPTPHANLTWIRVGPDGNLWFTESGGGGFDVSKIGRITPDGTITEFTQGLTPNCRPFGITAGPDGNVWFAEYAANKIGRITPDGVITEFDTPLAGPHDIALGADGALWFTEYDANKIGRITPTGVVTNQWPIPTPNSGPLGITAGPDGNLWFTEYNEVGTKIGRITTAGAITEFTVSTENGRPFTLTVGPDNDIWFTESVTGKIGKIYVLSGTGATLSATAGQRFAAVVASFHDDQPGMGDTSYTARVTWDDGHSSSGGIADNGDGTWDVAASHTYAASGTYTVTVTITDLTDSRMMTTTTGTVEVTAPAAPPSGNSGPDATTFKFIAVLPPVSAIGRITASLTEILPSHDAFVAEGVFSSPTVAPSTAPLPGSSFLSHEAGASSASGLSSLLHHSIPAVRQEPLSRFRSDVVDLLAINLWS